MKNKTWSFIGGIAAIVLVVAIGTSLLPGSTGSDLLNGTTTPAGTTVPTPGGNNSPSAGISFPDSDLITTSFVAAAKNAAWTTEDGYTLEYSEGSLYRMAIPGNYQLPDGDYLLKLTDDALVRVNGVFWASGTIPTTDMLQGRYSFKQVENAQIDNSWLQQNVKIYSRNDIQNNLQRQNITNEELNSLIQLLVCQGMYKESIVNSSMVWISDLDEQGYGYLGNRICMRYSVSVPYDVKVTFSEEAKRIYEYILYLFVYKA